MDQVDISSKNALLPRFVRGNEQKMSVACVLARFEWLSVYGAMAELQVERSQANSRASY